MNYRLGIDGLAPYGTETDLTCPPSSLCDYTEQGLACSFQSLLPSGPLWDRDKEDPNYGVSHGRTSLAAYAAYIGKVTFSIIQNSVWVAIREANPWTAVTTLDDWLVKLAWQDCYGACRDPNLVSMSPFEVMGMCGPLYCPPEYPGKFELALKSAMVKSLYRMRLGIIQNIAAMNFILEPLGAEVVTSWKDGISPLPGACRPDMICVTINKTRDYLEIPKLNCADDAEYSPAYTDQVCDVAMGVPQFVWPNLVAAECILRAMLPMNIKCVLPTPCFEPDEV